MEFSRLTPRDLPLVLGWIDEGDYLRLGVLEEAVEEGRAYAVRMAGEPIAVSIMRPSGRGVWLMGARVREGYRGRGVGTYMTESLLEEARRQGYEWAALMTAWDNEPVHRIASKIGLDRVSGMVWAPIGVEEYILYPGGRRLPLQDVARAPGDLVEAMRGALGPRVYVPQPGYEWAYTVASEGLIVESARVAPICTPRAGPKAGLALPISRRSCPPGPLRVALIHASTREDCGEALSCALREAREMGCGGLNAIIYEGTPIFSRHLENYMAGLKGYWAAVLYSARLKT